jgi:hypothetical protein
MILECLVTSKRPDGELNIAPMGPVVDEDDPDLDHFVLRPYQTAQTFSNLKYHGAGVLHITDDVELLARAAISQWDSLPTTEPAAKIEGRVIQAANRWYEFEVESIDEDSERATIQCRTVHRGRRADLLGLNRAKFAVLEAAILMTRLEILPRDEIERQMQQLGTIVGKTAGLAEVRAFELLQDYFTAHANAVTNQDG